MVSINTTHEVVFTIEITILIITFFVKGWTALEISLLIDIDSFPFFDSWARNHDTRLITTKRALRIIERLGNRCISSSTGAGPNELSPKATDITLSARELKAADKRPVQRVAVWRNHDGIAKICFLEEDDTESVLIVSVL